MSTKPDSRPGSAGLVAECPRCAGLCCVALPFHRSADFPFDKEAGQPCVHLTEDFRCEVHDSLDELGFAGCIRFDCFGAGQHVCEVTVPDGSAGSEDELAAARSAAFPLVRQLREILWYLMDASARSVTARHQAALSVATEQCQQLLQRRGGELTADDVAALREPVSELLREVSARLREGFPGRADAAGTRDYVGADLSTRDLRAADLRGALLIATDLRGTDLRGADLLGADLRDADIRGADLRGCLFVTPVQLAAARGDVSTRLPAGLSAPQRWSSGRAQARVEVAGSEAAARPASGRLGRSPRSSCETTIPTAIRVQPR